MKCVMVPDSRMFSTPEFIPTGVTKVIPSLKQFLPAEFGLPEYTSWDRIQKSMHKMNSIKMLIFDFSAYFYDIFTHATNGASTIYVKHIAVICILLVGV